MVLPHGRFLPELQPEARQERSLANRLHQVAADTKKHLSTISCMVCVSVSAGVLLSTHDHIQNKKRCNRNGRLGI